MYPAGLPCRVGGRPDGVNNPTCPLWRGITTHNIDGRRTSSCIAFSELAEECVPCRETRIGLEKSASGITGAVRKTRNNSGRRATGRTISRVASDLNLASNPADETTVMPTVPRESCVSANRNGNATRRRKWTRQMSREVMFCYYRVVLPCKFSAFRKPISCSVSKILL